MKNNNHVQNWLLGIGGIFLGIVLTCAVIIPQAVQVNNWNNIAVLQTAADYWASQGYVALADPSGNLIPLSGDNLSDLGSAAASWRDAYIDGVLYARTGRAVTYIIAASDAPTIDKIQADLLVTGAADEEIQAALNSGYDTRLTWGHYDIESGLTISNNNQALYSIEGGILVANASLTSDVILVTGDNVSICGITINGNKAARAPLSGDGIHLQGSSGSIVIGNRVYDIPSWGISLTDSSTYNQVKGNVIDSSEHNNIILRGQGTTYNVVNSNVSLGAVSDGIDLFEGSSYNTISNNAITGATANGIIVHPNTPAAAGERAYNNSITGNVISDSGNVGINIQNAYHQSISGNTIYNTTSTAIYLLDGSLYASIVGNTINTAQYGILISATNNPVVTGNGIYNCSVLGVGVGSSYGNYSNNIITNCAQGFNLAGNFDQNIISANIINNSTAEGIYFQGGGASDDNLIIGNQIYGGTRAIRFASPGVRNIVQSNVVRGASVSALVVDANTDQAFIVDNDFRQNSGPVYMLGTNLVVKRNLGYVTENSGSDNITSGSTSRVITHGCNYTPALADITIIFSNNSTNSIGNWWVDTITSTQFTVHVANDPGASHCYFSWSVRKN